MKKYLLLTFLFLSILCGCNNNRYTVSFVSNGGSLVNRITVKEGNTTSRPKDPEKEDESFEDWYKDNQTFLKKFRFESEIIDADIVLYAKWGKFRPEYTVTFNLNGGTGATPTQQNVQLGRLITDPNITPTKSGFIFAGWSSSKTSQGESDLFALSTRTVSGNITLYAVWIEESVRNQLLAAMNKIKNQEFVYAQGEKVEDGINISDNVWINYTNKMYVSKTYGLNNTVLGRSVYFSENEQYTYQLLPSLTRKFKYNSFETLVDVEFNENYLQEMKGYLDPPNNAPWTLVDGIYQRQEVSGTITTHYFAKLNSNNFIDEVGYLKKNGGSRIDSAKIIFKYTKDNLSFPTEIGDRASFTDTLQTKKVTIFWSDNYEESVLFQELHDEGKSFINVSSGNISRIRTIFSGEQCNNCWTAYSDKKHTREFSTVNSVEIGRELTIYAKKN